jgi:hypothetical protein
MRKSEEEGEVFTSGALSFINEWLTYSNNGEGSDGKIISLSTIAWNFLYKKSKCKTPVNVMRDYESALNDPCQAIEMWIEELGIAELLTEDSRSQTRWIFTSSYKTLSQEDGDEKYIEKSVESKSRSVSGLSRNHLILNDEYYRTSLQEFIADDIYFTSEDFLENLRPCLLFLINESFKFMFLLTG